MTPSPGACPANPDEPCGCEALDRPLSPATPPTPQPAPKQE